MNISDRDRSVIQLVARFRQASSRQIHDALFYNLQSQTPTQRCLVRLVEQQYLSRVEKRMPGGLKGGSGQYAYQLGRRGFYMYFSGSYRRARAVNYHDLAIVDAFLAFRRLERQGELVVVGVSTEPDCWYRVGAVDLRPDLFVEVQRAGATLKYFVEVDMASEGQKQIKAKLAVYWRAYQDADPAAWPVWPRCLWVGVDEERGKELSWLVGQEPDQIQELFQVTTLEGLSEFLIS